MILEKDMRFMMKMKYYLKKAKKMIVMMKFGISILVNMIMMEKIIIMSRQKRILKLRLFLND